MNILEPRRFACKAVRWVFWTMVITLAVAPTGALAQSSAPANGLTNMNYSRSRPYFPNVAGPYFSPEIPAVQMENSPRLHDLIQNGKLQLSLEDAISLALENNLNIEVSRFSEYYAQTDLLRTRAGGTTRGINPGLFGGVTAFGGSSTGGGGGGTGNAGGISGGGGAINTGTTSCCDPFAGVSFGWDQNTSPLNSQVISGIPTVSGQNSSVSTFFSQGFLTGTTFTVALSGFRQSTSSQIFNPVTGSGFVLFDPEVPAAMTIGFNQKLLNGFGRRANAKFIRIAENDVQQADSTFRQQVMTTVAQVLDQYYDLLYYRQNVQTAKQALTYDEQLLSDNKKQVEIGTLAPLEIVRAESQVATDQQNLVVAETNYLQEQELLKTSLSKHVTPDLAESSINATDNFSEPQPNDIPALPEALTSAEKNRPEIEQAQLNIRDQDITIENARNGLLPTLDLFGTYNPTGLSGNRLINQSGMAVLVPSGLGSSLSQVFRNTYPNYSFGVSLVFAIRNRSAQADMATALLQDRQLKVQLQQQQNQVAQDVRNAEIGVTQARAQVNAAEKAVVLAKETLDDERKKFQLGESTTLNVLLTEQQYIASQGTAAQAHDNYAKALVTFYQATGTTLDKFNIQLAEAKSGRVTRVPNIPGTPSTSTP